jgi:hypothetical protein
MMLSVARIYNVDCSNKRLMIDWKALALSLRLWQSRICKNVMSLCLNN